MKHLTKFSYLVILAVAVVIFGCKKNENGSPTGTATDPAKAKQQVTEANKKFVPTLLAFLSSGGAGTSGAALDSANLLYRQALTNDPGNLDAHFGVAMTEEILLGTDPDIKALFQSSGELVVVPLPGMNNMRSKRYSVTQSMSSSLQSKLMLLASSPLPQSLLKTYHSFVAADSSYPFSHYQDIMEAKLLPALSDVIQHLSLISQNSNYAFYITSQNSGIILPDSVRIDLTEIYLVLALTQIVDASASFLTAYNVDYDASVSASVQAAWQPTSSFLAFRSNGAQRMKDTKSNFVGMATSVQNGITFLLNQPPQPGIQLIHYGTDDVPYLMQIAAGMDSVKSLFAGTRTAYGDFNGDGTEDQVTVSFGSFFDNAVSNFKLKLPTYTSDTPELIDGQYHGALLWQSTSFDTWVFPDPTFNGFFPGMTDAQFKTTFGITGNKWQQRTVIK